MQTKLNPYINFKNNARDAMEFYMSVFGGEPQVQHLQRVSRLPESQRG